MKAFLNRALGRIVRLLPPTEIVEDYEAPELIEMIFRKAVDFSPQPSPEFEGRSAVLDFGGGFGQHYKCAVRHSPMVRWAVVETQSIVARASVLASEHLKFFATIEEAVDWLGKPDLMHSDSALHYTPDPVKAVKVLCGVGAKEMLWRRMVFSRTDRIEVDEQLSRLDEHGPKIASGSVSRKLVRIKRNKIPEPAFLTYHVGYRLVERNEGCFRFTKDRG
jgi:hypothetical protein